MDRLDKAIKIMMNEYSKTCGELEECEKCVFYDGDCNLDYLMNTLFKLDKAIQKEKSIVLKNIDTSMDFGELRNKLIKDREKFTNTVFSCMLSYVYKDKNIGEYKKDAIEAFWNMVQSSVGLLQKIDVDADEVMEYYNKHLEKIKK